MTPLTDCLDNRRRRKELDLRFYQAQIERYEAVTAQIKDGNFEIEDQNILSCGGGIGASLKGTDAGLMGQKTVATKTKITPIRDGTPRHSIKKAGRKKRKRRKRPRS